MKNRSTPLAALLLFGTAAMAQGPSVTDTFGRDVDAAGITLVDWEGHLANPAIRFRVHPPPSASFPVSATLSGDNRRLYFDSPSFVSGIGPNKTITLNDANPVQVSLSIFPDRDSQDETHRLNIDYVDAVNNVSNAALDIHVIDQDLLSLPGLAFFNQGAVFHGAGQIAVTNAARGQVGGPR